MVRACLTAENQTKVLRWLATEIKSALDLTETVEELLANPCLLHSYMVKTPVNWREIAKEVGVEEKKVARWYYKTHLRHILTIKMTNEDRGEIRKIIINWIRCQRVPSAHLYQVIDNKFGEKYSRQELKMTYYNILHSSSVRSILCECNVQWPEKRKKTSEAEQSSPPPATLHHIPGYTSDSHLSSVDTKRPSPLDSHTPSMTVPTSSEANIVVKGGATDNMSNEFTLNPLTIQTVTQQNAQIKLLNLPTIQIAIDPNSQLTYIPLIILDTGTNIWGHASTGNQAGNTDS